MDRMVFNDQVDSNGLKWNVDENGHVVNYVAPVDDGLVDKYRVYKITAIDENFEQVDPVESFTFVLKPNHDHHARVAIAAYAASCAIEKPQLSKDLYDLLSQDEWGSD